MSYCGGSGRRRRAFTAWRRAVAVAGTLALAGAAVLPGTGTAAAAARPTGPALVFSPSPYDYGQVSPGQSASQTFILSNSGQKATGKLRVRLSGPAAFSITGSTCRAARLRPGRTCTITVRFAPSQAGRITATLTAASKGGPQHAATATDALAGGQALGAAPGQIYWVSQDEIWAANLDGTSPHAILTGQDGPEGIAVNSSHLYWADDGDGTIWEANLDGTSPHIIFTGQRGLVGLAVTPSHIYWANDGGAGDRAGTIWAANLDGSNPHTIVTGQTFPDGVAADASHVYWSDEGLNEQPGNGTISEANPDGTSPHTIATGLTTPIGVAVDASHLYWASSGDGTVTQANLDGTSPHAIATDQNGPYGVASDASHLYWVNKDGGTVTRASPDGTSPHTIVTGQVSPTWMAVTPAAPELSLSPAPYDYGSVLPGQTATQTFTLTNSGGAATGPLTVTLTGPAAFAVTGNACAAASLGPGQTCNVTAGFTPAAEGAMTATLTAASTNPVATATDALSGTMAPAIYWANAGNHSSGAGAIWMANLDGTSPHAIATGQDDPAGVAVDASHLYWANTDDNAIVEAGLDGSSPRTIVINQDAPFGVAISAGHLYWSNFGADEEIWEANLDGSSPHAIVNGQNNPTGVAADGSHLYWATFGAIWEANLDGSNPHTIVTGALAPELQGGVAVNADHLDGSNPHTIIVTGQNAPEGVAVAGQLYWSDVRPGAAGTGRVGEANLDGSSPHIIVTGQDVPQMMAVTPVGP